MGEVVALFEDDLDITGWTEAQILRWEAKHEQFATTARMNAAVEAADRRDLTPEVLAESERWAKIFEEEALHDDRP